MADWHLKVLSDALTHAGWTIAEHETSDGVRTAGTWQIQRNVSAEPLHIDFGGTDDGVRCLAMTESYGCHVRSLASHSLYFGRRRMLQRWRAELQSFVKGLDELEVAERDLDE